MKNRERVIKSRPSWRKKTQVQRIRFVMAMVATALCLAVAAGVLLTWVEVKRPFDPPASSAAPSSAPADPEDEAPPEYEDSYNLLLVNSSRRLPDDYTAGLKLEKLGDVRVDARILPALKAMLDAAEEDGTALTPASAYVSPEEQTQLFNDGAAALMKDGKYTQARAEDKMQTLIGAAGFNENQLGMSVDFAVPVGTAFEKTPEYRWLVSNSAEYGFIQRFPQNKAEATGRDFAPAHFRYVGVTNALKMRQYAMCLEEYVAYLAKQARQ